MDGGILLVYAHNEFNFFITWTKLLKKTPKNLFFQDETNIYKIDVTPTGLISLQTRWCVIKIQNIANEFIITTNLTTSWEIFFNSFQKNACFDVLLFDSSFKTATKSGKNHISSHKHLRIAYTNCVYVMQKNSEEMIDISFLIFCDIENQPLPELFSDDFLRTSSTVKSAKVFQILDIDTDRVELDSRFILGIRYHSLSIMRWSKTVGNDQIQ